MHMIKRSIVGFVVAVVIVVGRKEEEETTFMQKIFCVQTHDFALSAMNSVTASSSFLFNYIFSLFFSLFYSIACSLSFDCNMLVSAFLFNVCVVCMLKSKENIPSSWNPICVGSRNKKKDRNNFIFCELICELIECIRKMLEEKIHEPLSSCHAKWSFLLFPLFLFAFLCNFFPCSILSVFC